MYRSKFEQEVSGLFTDGCYECEKLEYTIPEKKCKYLIDFKDEDGVYFEVKGRFRTLDEARKYLYIRDCNPNIDLRFIIQDEKTLMPRSKKKTMKRWLEDNGFKVYLLDDLKKNKEN